MWKYFLAGVAEAASIFYYDLFKTHSLGEHSLGENSARLDMESLAIEIWARRCASWLAEAHRQSPGLAFTLQRLLALKIPSRSRSVLADAMRGEVDISLVAVLEVACRTGKSFSA